MKVTLRPPGHWLVLPCILLPVALLAADDPLDKVSRLANEWVKTRAETVRLETEWNSHRALMQSMVDALEQRSRIIQEKMEHLKAKTAEDRGELDTLGKKNDLASSGLVSAEARLKETAQHVIALRPFLPPRLAAALDLPYRSLSDPALSVSDRMQHTMTILNRCMQFNRVITASDEVLTLAGEPAPKSLEVIYWGLSHGYALDRVANKAWLGAPGPQGWQWEAHPEATGEVARLLAIATDQADPDFIVVPAKISHASK